MLKTRITFLFIVFGLYAQIACAQDSVTINETPPVHEFNFMLNQSEQQFQSPTLSINDSVALKTKDFPTKINIEPFKPDPRKAVIYSVIFPGLGQIYNRKYWKLPIIYGGFLGLTYAITWNGRYYNDYSNAYRAIMQEKPLSPENSSIWLPMLGRNKNPGSISESDIQRYRGLFKRQKDYLRRNRDLSIIGAVALYGLCIVDAYVDAQLFDFDISPDISMRVQPTIIHSSPSLTSNGWSYGMQCSLTF